MTLKKRLAAGLLAMVTAIGATISAGAEPEASSQIEAYAVSGDFEYETNDTGITITGYTGSCSAVTIPEEIDGKRVTEIGSEAFASSKGLTSITIPDGVTKISDEAFGYCYNLASVTIPNSVITIGEKAFVLTALTSVTIPNSVTSIGKGAFERCENLTSISVESENNAFSSVSGILYSKDGKVLVQYPTGKKEDQFVIPNTVASIGYGAFMDCEALQAITIPGGVTSIGDSAFHGCENLENVTIPSSVTSIGSHAFRDCESFTVITIPDSVTSIGKWAFYGCWSVTDVTISNRITLIDENTFGCCFRLARVTIPNSVTSIGESAFYGAAFTSVTIPNSVTSIGDGAFSGCDSLTSVTIPNSVTSIGKTAFTGNVLTNILVDSENKYFSSISGILYSKDGRTLVQYPTGKEENQFIIPNSVTSIGDSAFNSCKNLTNVTIPNSVTSIGDSAFNSCKNLTNVTIPNSVTVIGKGAFGYCTNLTSAIFLGNNIQFPGHTLGEAYTPGVSEVFYDCSKLTLYGEAESTVEAHAIENSIPFIAIDVPAAPTFTPNGGTFTEAQTVTIECTTEGMEIYYTLDGTEPTAISTKYTAPVPITESVTLKAVAVKDGISSVVTSVDFTINLSESQKQGFSSAGSSIADVPVNTVVTQKTAVADEKYNERFVKKVAASDVVGKTKATFTLSNGTVTKTVSTTKYNTALAVDGETVSAGSGYVFLVYTLSGIPEDVTVTVGNVVLE